MTETQFPAAVLDMARSPGMPAHHCRDSRLCDGPAARQVAARIRSSF